MTPINFILGNWCALKKYHLNFIVNFVTLKANIYVFDFAHLCWITSGALMGTSYTIAGKS